MRPLIFFLLLFVLCSGMNADNLAFWRFENNLIDSSGNGHTLSVGQGNISFVQGMVGQGALFDRNTYLTINSPALNDNFTSFSLGAWVFVDPSLVGTAFDSGIVAQRNLAYGLTYHHKAVDVNNPGRLFSYVHDGSTKLNNPFDTGVFRHVAQTFDGDIMRLYIDGIEVGSKEAISSVGVEQVDTGFGVELRIGRSFDFDNGTESSFFGGVIDEVFFTTDVLSAQELDDLVNSSAIPEPSSQIFLSLALLFGYFLKRKN